MGWVETPSNIAQAEGILDGLAGGAVIALALILISAAASKVRNATVFGEEIANYRLLPYGLTQLAARLVILWEAGSGILLMIPATRRGGAFGAIGILLVFEVAMLLAWQRGLTIACGCFGSNGSQASSLDLVGPPTLVRTLLLLVLGLISVGLHSQPFTFTSGLEGVFLAVIVMLGGELTRLVMTLREDIRTIRPWLELERRRNGITS